MGQKTNPIIFQLKKTNNWKSKYFETKTPEFSIYSKKDIELRNFIEKFFIDHKIIINNLKLYYFKQSIHVFISYQQSTNILLFTWKKKLFLNLINFTKKKYKFFILLEKLNTSMKQTIVYRKINKLCKKNLINLRKYNSNSFKKHDNFFTKGVNLLFSCVTNKKCAKLLTHFITIQLKKLDKLKRHNLFLNFIKNALSLFRKTKVSPLLIKGIKIKIKGRLNSRSRSKSKIIEIANNVSVITIDSILDYSNQTVFTLNGTFGVKVWIHEI